MPNPRPALPALALLAILAACTTSEAGRVAKLVPADPTPARFILCHGNSCRLHTAVSLSPAEWRQVRDLFVPAPADAADERHRIALATGLLEILAGRQAGTLRDAPGMGVHWDPDGQLDCIDETANTTQYLQMMAADGLIRFHRVGTPTNRFVLDAWGPSNTATIVETATGREYAVDSYFLANGEPASIIPINVWLAGWVPEDGPPPAS